MSCEAVNDRPLILGGAFEHRVEGDGRRHGELRDELDDLLAVGAAEDPELVLDRHGVVRIQNLGRSLE